MACEENKQRRQDFRAAYNVRDSLDVYGVHGEHRSTQRRAIAGGSGGGKSEGMRQLKLSGIPSVVTCAVSYVGAFP